MSVSIVIVSDDAGSRGVHAHMLRTAGHAVIARDDACGLIELVRAERPALLVLDFVIAGEDGLSLCERIKADPDCASTRVVMLAEPTTQAAALRAKRAGAFRAVSKPVQSSALLGCARGAAPSKQSLVLRMLRSLGA